MTWLLINPQYQRTNEYFLFPMIYNTATFQKIQHKSYQPSTESYKSWSFGAWLHCSDVGKPAEPKPQQFKCDIFFSLEMLGIYVAIYFFKLLPFSWKGRKIVKFYCGAERITSALRENNTAIREPSRVHQGSRKVHWNNSSPSLRGFKEHELWCSGKESEAPWGEGGKQGSSHSNTLNSVILRTLKTFWKLKYW